MESALLRQLTPACPAGEAAPAHAAL